VSTSPTSCDLKACSTITCRIAALGFVLQQLATGLRGRRPHDTPGRHDSAEPSCYTRVRSELFRHLDLLERTPALRCATGS
jgi:hypothetical protein